MINFIIKTKEDFFKSQNKSFFIYTYAFIFFLISCVILIIFQKFNKYIGETVYIFSIFFLIAILLDLYFLTKLIWDKIYIKLIYSILGYFAYIESTVIAKNIIYINIGLNPDSLQSSIDYLSGWFLIPAWIIYISFLFSSLAFVIIIIQCILIFIKGIFLNSFEKKIFFHSSFFLLGISSFSYHCNELIYKIYDYSNSNIVKKKIIETSYYLNNNFICNNNKIKHNDYIKVIGDNIVSIAKINDDNKITFHKEICNN